MKQLKILLILVLFTPFLLFSQNFEGVVLYKMNYTVNNTTLSEQELKEELGTDVKTYYKDGYYLEETNSSFMSYQQFSPKDTLIYYKNNLKSDTLFYKKTNIKTNEEFSYKIEKKADTILGYICDKLIVQDKHGSKSYYYSSQLSLNPDDYKNFLNSNKNKIVELMKAIYLRLEMKYSSFTVDIIATNIKRKKVNKDIFKLPKNCILIESDF